MGATRRGRSVRRVVLAGIAGAVVLSLGVSPVAAEPTPGDGTGEPGPEADLVAELMADLMPTIDDTDEPSAGSYTAVQATAGLPMLEPEIVLAEGRSAREGAASLLNIGPEALVYRGEREGNWVAYGPGYAERRRVTEVLPPLWVAGEWVVGGGPDARRWVDVQHVTGGAVSTYPLSSGAGFIAANADGWLEWARTGRSVEVFQMTIGADGAVTRASKGVVATLPAGDRIYDVFGGGVTSFDGTQTVATVLVFGERLDGADRALEYRLLRFSTGPGAGQPEVIDSSRSYRDILAPLQVTDDAIIVKGSHYLPDGNSVSEFRRLQDGQWQVWRATGYAPRESVAVVGDRVLWFERGGRGRVEGLPDGRVVPVTDAWSGLPWDARSAAVGDGVVVGWGDRILRTGPDPADAEALVELPAMPLRVAAFDLEAGTAAWVDDSATTAADGSAWMRSLILDAGPVHLYDRAVGSSVSSSDPAVVHLAGGSVFGYRDLPETYMVVRADRTATAPVAISRAGYARPLLGGTTQVYVPNVRGTYPNYGALIDVATNRTAPSPSLEALNDVWSVRYVETTGIEAARVRATHLPSGGYRTVTIGGYNEGMGLVGSTLVWISMGSASEGTLNTVDLSRGSTVTATRFGPGAVAATDAAHVAVRPTNTTRGDVVTIYRLGSTTPVAAVESVGRQVAIDGGRVLWVAAGPDGDRLVSARIPGAPLFTDVPLTSTFATEIEWLVEAGIGTGYADGTFRPGGMVSRQAMAAFLFRAEGADFTAPATATFTDVSPGSSFFREIEWMVHSGLATVDADQRFRPGDPVSRQAMAAYLYRAAGSPELTLPDTPTFTDVPATSAFFTEIEWLAQSGITSGYADGTFRPDGQVSRQAMAAFLHRFNDLRG